MTLQQLLFRLGQGLLTLIGMSVVIFILVRVIPGDPITLLAAEALPQEIIDQQRRAFGLDKPLGTQYVIWLSRIATGDFGVSWRHHRSASQVVFERLPATIQLSIVSFSLAVAIGLPAGIAASTRRNSTLDYIVRSLSVIGQGVPIFWLGIMLIMFFAVRLNWLPTSGRGGWQHLILPSFTLATWLLPPIARLTRANMLEILSTPYVVTASAKGLTYRLVVVRHALRNALIPIVTLLGVQLGNLLSGAIVTEAVFAWPGIGSLMVDAIRHRDYPLVQAGVILSVLIYIGINIVADFIIAQLDPRISAL